VELGPTKHDLGRVLAAPGDIGAEPDCDLARAVAGRRPDAACRRRIRNSHPETLNLQRQYPAASPCARGSTIPSHPPGTRRIAVSVPVGPGWV
jgi:hypothetical protein